jgi:GNAT superfamily N-acetyltransferase
MAVPGNSTDSLIPQDSLSESNRFGLAVARLTVDHPEGFDIGRLTPSLVESGADVVIVRYPNQAVELFSQLLGLEDYVAIFADCLMYWNRELTSANFGTVSDDLRVTYANAQQVGELVRPVFSQYPSHYAANPLFDPAAVLEGYVEWVSNLVEGEQATCLVLLDEHDDYAGFAVTDFSEATPDIRFGGISPSHRSRGIYRELIVASMELARQNGRNDITISTQAHNVKVMSTWARLGWTPRSATTTVHLVRRTLLTS